MNIHFSVDLVVPRWLKRTAFLSAGVAALVVGASSVYADVPHTYTDGQTLGAASLNENFNDIDSRLSALEVAVMPPGTIVAYGGAGAPEGWLPCDGTQLDGTSEAYAALYEAIGTSFGGNTTSKTFNLPDLRGRFVRGVDDGSGHDPDAGARVAIAMGGNDGDDVGTLQGSAVESHSHGVNDPGHVHATPHYLNGNIATGGPATVWGTFTPAGGTPPTLSSTTGISIANTGGDESRPPNVSVRYIIKL